MSNPTNNKNRPTHAIWQVQGEGEKSRWTRVGSAWMHKDLKGANLKFDSIPLSGRVVMREIAEDAKADMTVVPEGGAQ